MKESGEIDDKDLGFANINNPVNKKNIKFRYDAGDEWLKDKYGGDYYRVIEDKITEYYGPGGCKNEE